MRRVTVKFKLAHEMQELMKHQPKEADLTIGDIVSRIGTKKEQCLFHCSKLFAFLTGAAVPAFALVLGTMIDALGQTSENAAGVESQNLLERRVIIGESWKQVKVGLERMIVVAFYAWITWALMVFGFNYVASKVGNRFRILYFSKILEKDAKFFAENDPSAMTLKISNEASIITHGVGHNYRQVIQGYSAMLIAVVVAFLYGWMLCLLLCITFPVISVLIVFQSKMGRESSNDVNRAYQQSSGYAEQALKAIKVVQMYGHGDLELQEYTRHIENVRIQSGKSGMAIAWTSGILTFCVTLFYAWSFFMTGVLRSYRVEISLSEQMKTDLIDEQVYSGGISVAIVFCLILGVVRFLGAVSYH